MPENYKLGVFTKTKYIKVPRPSFLPDADCWVASMPDGALSVIFSIEKDEKGRQYRHASIAHEHRYPSWNEIKEIRYSFFPDDITVAMILPPQKEYVNIHPNCFHLWEITAMSAPAV